METNKLIGIYGFFLLLILEINGNAQDVTGCKTRLEFYPKTYEINPELPSPCILEDKTEIIVVGTKDGKYAIIPVTVENGEPRNYNNQLWGKGNQLEVGCDDFPTLAKTGLHSEKELKRTQTITGKPVEQITKEGQPGNSSFEGFLADNEDIISVLTADNNLVKQLGFTHPKMTKPLFHVFNLILEHRKHYMGRNRVFDDFEYILYNGKKIEISWGGDKGCQASIFNDSNLGYYWIKLKRGFTAEEMTFLKKRYSKLNETAFKKLTESLSVIYTGEMVPYYIMRYGFYEGHTRYRTDPIAISFVFGLKSLPEIDKALQHKIHSFQENFAKPTD